jgi:hypothetical protein
MKIPPWTASSIDAFITCPHKFYRLRVVRDVRDLPMSEQSLWGKRVHKAFEDAVNWGDPLADEYKQWQPLVKKIQALPGEKFPEFRFSIDQDFNQCPWKDAWSRGMADLVVRNGKEAIILDYKTGKRKPSDQLQLYAGFAFAYWPELEKVHTAFVWLKDKVIDRKTYEAKDKAEIWANWMPLYKRYERAFETDVWMKHPSGLCRNWCPVKDCEFCGV